ncbi:MAG: 23S rRNA pseudouridine(1911/1915/1917) synthase RluD [Gammaproteobacteria bacterium]|nr:23S rRNA pseudouridine(1911/1915/1917) synthase RluD [Gammaproteobacteria bacterium]
MSEVRTHQLIIPETLAGARLDRALSELLADYSRTLLKTLIEEGRVLVNGATRRPRDPVRAGDEVALEVTLAATGHLAREKVDFEVVHADRDVIVVNKPAGLVVHPGAGNPGRTLVNGLLHRYPKLAELPRAGLIHRLDKDTSGLLVVARTPAAFQTLTSAMAGREIHRRYHAIVNGVMVAGGTVDAAISRDRVHRTRMRVSEGGREAVTHHRVLKRFRAHTYVELTLETGRTHQIRVHMQHIGYPILGDPVYGGRRRLPPAALPELVAMLDAFDRQALHAREIAFEHPRTGEPLAFECALPGDFEAVLEVLEADRVAVPA